MPMKQFQNQRLISLFTESLQVSNEEILNAYEDFVEHVGEMCDSETNNSVLFRILYFYRTEFELIKSNFLYDQEKKCIQTYVST
jgi:hypothetical protein